MKIQLPSGIAVEIVDPKIDFPRLIDEAEDRESMAHEDVKLLKRFAKQMEAWPIADESVADVTESKEAK